LSKKSARLFLVDLTNRIAGIDAEIKNEIAKRSDEIVQEARSLHQRIEKLIGQRADEDIVFGDYDEVIIESGETTSIGHLSSVQELVNALLNELQSDMEEERQQAIAQLKFNYENFQWRHAALDWMNTSTDLQNRIQTIRDTARRTRDDLEKIHRGQFLSETQYREMKNRFGNVFEANMGAEAFHQILSTLDLESLAEELMDRGSHHPFKATQEKGDQTPFCR
jgi:DNA-directed RNA polymerase subunit beta'